MPTPYRPPFCLLPLALLALAAPAAQAADAADAALRQCRAIAEAPARLACYDALPLGRTASAPPAATATAPAAVTVAAATPSTPAPAAATAARFGLPESAAAAVQQVDSHIEGRFEGWGPRQRIRLANGQVWQIQEDTRGSYWLDSPRATVRRGALGSYMLDIEGVKALLRVRRVE